MKRLVKSIGYLNS